MPDVSIRDAGALTKEQKKKIGKAGAVVAPPNNKPQLAGSRESCPAAIT